MKIPTFILVLILSPSILFSQALDFLDQSTSDDPFTSHSFHASAYHDGYFYLGGEFWKDITFGNFSIPLLAGAEGAHRGFIVKVSASNGEVEDLWEFRSQEFVRINKIEIDSANESLLITGQFRENISYQNEEWDTPFFADGFIMSLNVEGSLNWLQQIYSQSELSFASGESIVMDDAGNIFVGLEFFGTVEIDGQSFTVEEEKSGALILKLDQNGALLDSQAWIGNTFENTVDITDMALDSNGDLLIAGGFSGGMAVGNQMLNSFSAGGQPFLLKENSDLDLMWINQYFSSSALINDLYFFEDKIFASTQYRDFLQIDNFEITGSGSWGDLAILSLAENGDTEVVQNLKLTENGGIRGVYGLDMVNYDGKLYIGGMYQGAVEDEQGALVLGDANSFDNQFPFLLSLNTDGQIQDIYDFDGSFGPSLMQTVTASEHHLLFGGEFTNQISIEDQSLQTINSTLFYGAFWDGIDTGVSPLSSNEHCIEKIATTVQNELLTIQSNTALEQLWVVDVSGKLVKTVAGNNDLYQALSLTDLASGIYFLNIECQAGISRYKFVR